MTTLDIVAALIVATHRNDLDATARLIDQLETRLPPEEVVAILEALVDEPPAPALTALPIIACT